MYILAIIALIVATSCEKQVETWSGEDSINFYTPAVRDTIQDFSFLTVSVDLTEYTMYLEVRTEGMIRNYPRPVNLRQIIPYDTAGNDAVAGVHYVAFNDPRVRDLYVIPAGEYSVFLPIILLRHPSLGEERKTLRIEFMENDYFQLTTHENRGFRIIRLVDRVVMPVRWYHGPGWSLNFYFGTYGPVKHRFMISTVGDDFDDAWVNLNFATTWWDGMWNARDADHMTWLQNWLQRKLEERNEREGNILTEADGTIVDFWDLRNTWSN